jgi:hypothetical protein
MGGVLSSTPCVNVRFCNDPAKAFAVITTMNDKFYVETQNHRLLWNSPFNKYPEFLAAQLVGVNGGGAKVAITNNFGIPAKEVEIGEDTREFVEHLLQLMYYMQNITYVKKL